MGSSSTILDVEEVTPPHLIRMIPLYAMLWPTVGHAARQDPLRGDRTVMRPRLLERLETAGRVTVVCAPPGSGKSVVLRSWAGWSGHADRIAWVGAARTDGAPEAFWLAVRDALAGAAGTAAAMRAITPTSELDGGALLERLLEDLEGVDGPVWLVIDDLHEAHPETVRQLGLLVLRPPSALRLVISTRHDLPLGLHRLRLEGELTEIRARDLGFTIDEARSMFEAAGVVLSDSALARLHDRTEGWPAGLRLAALSLAGHPEPDRFAFDFTGSERTVAEYLLAEVLGRLPDEVCPLLLRTSILERVNGPLADLLTGGSDGERVLHDLERVDMFVVATNPERTWFRYHRLFADLLELELRRRMPEDLGALHRAAAGWFAEHHMAVEAIRHAQRAEDWAFASELLFDHWVDLSLSGRGAAAHALLSAFPPEALATDPQLLVVVTADELAYGSLDQAQRKLALAVELSPAAPAGRQGALKARLAAATLHLARSRGDLDAAVAQAKALLFPPDGSGDDPLEVDHDLHAMALLDLGIAELWTANLDEAEQHLEQAIVAARLAGRPSLELAGLGSLSMARGTGSLVAATRTSGEAIDLATGHGWEEEPPAATAFLASAVPAVWQGRLDDADRLLERAGRALRSELDPSPAINRLRLMAMTDLARDRDRDALISLRAAHRLETHLSLPARRLPFGSIHTGALLLETRLRLGEVEAVANALTAMAVDERSSAPMRRVEAALELSRGAPERALLVLAPVAADPAAWISELWEVDAALLEAIAHHELSHVDAAADALERALERAEPDAIALPFLLRPVSDLLERQQGHRGSHAALLFHIVALRAGWRTTTRQRTTDPLLEPLSDSEMRVLRYLPTNLTAPEIAGELYVSVATVKTHIQHVYAKLDAHRRAGAVERARALGLLAPAPLDPMSVQR